MEIETSFVLIITVIFMASGGFTSSYIINTFDKNKKAREVQLLGWLVLFERYKNYNNSILLI